MSQLSDKKKLLIKRFGELRAARSNLESIWQDVDDLTGGNAGITTDKQKGSEKAPMSDSTGEQAVYSYTRFLASVLRPNDKQWITGAPKDMALLDDKEAREGFDLINERMLKSINMVESRFAEATWKTDLSLTRYACAFLFMDVQTFGTDSRGRPKRRLRFLNFHPKDCYFDVDHNMQPNAVYRKYKYTASQAMGAFKEKRNLLSEEIHDAYEKGENTEFEFLSVTVPNEDRNLYGFKKNLDGDYLSCDIDLTSQELVQEGQYEEFPWAIPRQNVMPGQTYGYSVAMSALPEVRMSQFIADAIMDATEYQLDPSLLVSSAIENEIDISPGSLIHYDPTGVQNSNRPAVERIQLGGEIAVGLEHQRETRNQIMKYFLDDVFNLPDQGSMTATEIQRRNDDLARIIGPITQTLLPDYNGAIAWRVFNLMRRRDQFLDDQGRDFGGLEDEIEFQYQNPVQELMNQTKKAFIDENLAVLGQVAPIKPDITDNFDIDMIMRDRFDLSLESKYIIDLDQVKKIREGRAQQQQAIQQAGELEAMSGTGANIAQNIGAIDQQMPGGIEGIIQQLSGGAQGIPGLEDGPIIEGDANG